MAQALTGFTKYTQQMPTQTRQRRFVLGPVVVLVGRTLADASVPQAADAAVVG